MADAVSPMTVTCFECQRTFTIATKPGDLERWRAGGLIQDVMPYLSEADRELLISATCGECFERMFEGCEGSGLDGEPIY